MSNGSTSTPYAVGVLGESDVWRAASSTWRLLELAALPVAGPSPDDAYAR